MIDSEKYFFDTLCQPLLQLCCSLNIHPNLITSLSLLSTFLLFYSYLHNITSLFILAVFIKWFADGLDGAVARYCKKTSKFGGYLDYTADMLFLTIAMYIIMSFYFSTNMALIMSITSAYLMQLYVLYTNSTSALSDHDILKDNNINGLSTFISIVINNVSILYIMFVFYYVQMKNI